MKVLDVRQSGSGHACILAIACFSKIIFLDC